MRANHVLIKNYSILGLHWGLYFQRAPELIPGCTAELMRLYAEGAILPHVSERFPLSGAKAGLAAVAGRRSTGKVVLMAEPERRP